MLSKEEAKALRQAFWTAYGDYMSHNVSARRRKTRWLDYPTGVKDIYFRQEADEKVARVAIDIQHKDPGIRALFYDQFWELETLLHTSTATEWVWERQYRMPTGHEISRIYVEKEGLSVYDHRNWPALFAFFEHYMVPLDAIWADAIDIFQDLAS